MNKCLNVPDLGLGRLLFIAVSVGHAEYALCLSGKLSVPAGVCSRHGPVHDGTYSLPCVSLFSIKLFYCAEVQPLCQSLLAR